MLILIGTVPTAYALNRAMPRSQIEAFRELEGREQGHQAKAAGYNVLGNPRPAVTNYVAEHQINEGTFPSLAVLVRDIAKQVNQYGSLAKVPAEAVGNTRNDMYLVSEAIRFLMKDKEADLSSETSRRSTPTRARSTARPSSSRSGSRSRSRSRSASAPWSAGSASSSPSARRSARPT